jgi:ABC-type transporter Mla subunit MlaD
MPLQDLTPQLRTRLNKVERSVGWFIFLATVLLLFGFGYFIYNTAERKGWFLVEAKFYTYVNTAAGLKVGDPIVVMGFPVGAITQITAEPPRTGHNVRVQFVIKNLNQDGTPYFNYVWTDGSAVKLNSTDLLGNRNLEVTRGTSGYNVFTMYEPQTLSLAEAQNLHDPEKWRLGQNLYDEQSNLVVRAWSSLAQSNLTVIVRQNPGSIVAFHITPSARHRQTVAAWNKQLQCYERFDYRSKTNAYFLPVTESPAISDQLQAMVTQIQQALPNVLALTNQLNAVLNHAANATSNLNLTIAATQPLVGNLTALSSDLHGAGALGAWVLGTNGTFQLDNALTNANALLIGANTNLDELTQQIGLTLINVADITSNLNVQVGASSNLIPGISKTIKDTDDFIQGLKRHWLLRSAFKTNKVSTYHRTLKNPPPTPAK